MRLNKSLLTTKNPIKPCNHNGCRVFLCLKSPHIDDKISLEKYIYLFFDDFLQINRYSIRYWKRPIDGPLRIRAVEHP